MTNIIPIYKAEVGLKNKILASNAIAYVSELVPESDQTIKDKVLAQYSSQGGQHDRDLYYTRSVLVTTSWNKNDDVFDSREVWAARKTPTHKPTNIEHDEKQLVGHITENWAIDIDGNLIDEESNVDSLPGTFHVVNGAVIYTSWEDGELEGRAKRLIEEIEAGTKFVSMECLFTNFDYAINPSEGSQHIVARNEETAWMTKHLKSYGGAGEYEGNRIGRLLRNITFCGKGYVDMPANPDSIIFNKDMLKFKSTSTEKTFIINNGVILDKEAAFVSGTEEITEVINMADNILQDQINELKATLKTETEARKKAEKEVTEAGVATLKADNEDLKKKYDAQCELVSKTDEKVAESDEKVKSLSEELEEVKEAKSTLEKEMNEIKAAELRSNRISILVDGKIDKKIATEKVEMFSNLTDEQFEDLAGELIGAQKGKNPFPKKDKDKDEDEDKDKAASTVDDKTLDVKEGTAKADVNLANVGDDDEEDELQTVRSELQNAIANRLGLKSKKTEE